MRLRLLEMRQLAMRLRLLENPYRMRWMALCPQVPLHQARPVQWLVQWAPASVQER